MIFFLNLFYTHFILNITLYFTFLFKILLCFNCTNYICLFIYSFINHMNFFLKKKKNTKLKRK